MKTLLALVAAAAMIVGALYARGAIWGEEDAPALGRSDPLHIVCITELRAVCGELAGDDVTIRIEEAGETAAALSGGDPPVVDGWFTLKPWTGIVAEERQRASLPPLLVASDVVARSPLVLVIRDERFAVLDCSPTDWVCVGSQSGRSWEEIGGEAGWGRFRPGLSDPQHSGTGLLVLGQAATQFLGDTRFSASDLDEPKFASWLADLKRAVPASGGAIETPLQAMLVRAGAYDVVGTTEAEAATLLSNAAPQRVANLSVVYPQPPTVAEVVLAPLNRAAEDGLSDLEDRAAAALARSGWRVEGEPAAAGVDAQEALPDEPNVPKPGVLEALRLRWGEIAR